MPDLESAIIDQLRAGQSRSLVELVVDLPAPYEDLQPALRRLTEAGILEIDESEDQTVFRLAPNGAAARRPSSRLATFS